MSIRDLPPFILSLSKDLKCGFPEGPAPHDYSTKLFFAFFASAILRRLTAAGSRANSEVLKSGSVSMLRWIRS